MLALSISALDPLAGGQGAPSGSPRPSRSATPAEPAQRAESTGSAEPPTTGTVIRPEPGLARGRWEAPPWVFYAVAAAAVVIGVTWIVLAWRTRRSPARKEHR